MKVEEIRNKFFEYFAKNGHEIVPSSPLVPFNDETLLFTNAGMVQFKEAFLGQEKRPYSRAVSSQRCVRAGGKHNDLENVGYTARHHTFFEMLGNFSFGDYFKREAINYAWEFLTKELGLPAEKLWITVYEEDDEAEDIWLKELKVSKERFSRCGKEDNFWAMGDTGPCGPCTEIFYDHGPEVAGGPPGSPDQEGDRYIEIWNLVFMQYNRAPDGTLTNLPKPSVDTGMGLERLAAVLQGVHSNYEIDLFANIILAGENILGIKEGIYQSLRVIADHIRSCAFLITDGVIPSNEGRGYVLRRIIRRAIRHGHKLGAKEPFFYLLVEPLVVQMGKAFPELATAQQNVENILLKEEQQFDRTLDQGLGILEQDLANLKTKTIPGDILFKLYDTYGFPVDLTADIAREHGLEVDRQGFEDAMDLQRQRARQASQFSEEYHVAANLSESTEFSGYSTLEDSATILKILAQGESVEQLAKGEKGTLILDNTPFYAQSGGQVGDQGKVCYKENLFKVEDTQKSGKAFLHIGVVQDGIFKVGDKIKATVNKASRTATMLNHSATHLLHAALRKILGSHVVQKGSYVGPEKLRFDFAHDCPLTAEEIAKVEIMVNEQIRKNSIVQTDLMDSEQALASGAMALFGEKYGEKVRVLTMGDKFSVELCGGTHVSRTGDIGFMKITNEIGISQGVRRIDGVTGAVGLDLVQNSEIALRNIQDLLRTDSKNAQEKLVQSLNRLRALEKENKSLKMKLATNSGSDLSSNAIEVGELKVLSYKLPTGDIKMMRTMVDDLKNKLGTGIVVLSLVQGNKVSLIAGVTKDCTERFSAGELINFVAQQVGGKGGGRADMAQAGGNDPSSLDKALASVESWVKERI